MTTSREYRQFVRECTNWAAEATTEEARKLFLELARDWTFAAMVADRVEKQDAAGPGPPQSVASLTSETQRPFA